MVIMSACLRDCWFRPSSWLGLRNTRGDQIRCRWSGCHIRSLWWWVPGWIHCGLIMGASRGDSCIIIPILWNPCYWLEPKWTGWGSSPNSELHSALQFGDEICDNPLVQIFGRAAFWIKIEADFFSTAPPLIFAPFIFPTGSSLQYQYYQLFSVCDGWSNLKLEISWCD